MRIIFLQKFIHFSSNVNNSLPQVPSIPLMWLVCQILIQWTPSCCTVSWRRSRRAKANWRFLSSRATSTDCMSCLPVQTTLHLMSKRQRTKNYLRYPGSRKAERFKPRLYQFLTEFFFYLGMFLTSCEEIHKNWITSVLKKKKLKYVY